MADKVKILCLSIWYPLSMSRYFERAMRRNPNIDLKTCGPYTGAWIPWMGGMTLLQKYAVPPNISLPLPPNVGKVAYDLVKAQLLDEWHPDIVMTIDAGICWSYKPSEGIVVHVATDPHCLQYDHQRGISDKFFNMQKFYSKPGDIYLPYAYDPTVHYPMDIEKTTDAVLIGMPYDNRTKLVEALKAKGVSIIFVNGPVFDEYREAANRARIGLNWSSLNDLNARAFEIPAMGLYPIMNAVPDMGEFEFLSRGTTFRSLDAAVEAVLWAKANADEASKFAALAHKEVEPHTYDARIDQILKECKF